MGRMTIDRIGKLGSSNAEKNLDRLAKGQSIAALLDEIVGESDSAIVIAAGPSVKRTEPLKRIKESGYKGAIIATDSAMLYCLREGVIPDLVVTLDPHGERIVRWFGDPDLSAHALEKDDYFRRQDMDDAFSDEIRVNDEIMDLLAEYGPRMRIAVASSSSTEVIDRIAATGMKAYWWNPFFDDPDRPNSISRRLWNQNKLPLINAGGNVGTACWMIAHAVLGKKHVALSGLDFAYYGDTPYERSQYYREAVDLVGEDNLDDIFIHINNPHLNQDFYTDPAYMWYRECFLSLVPDAECTTYNCTGGGILFGDGITFENLQIFLDRKI